MPRLRFAPDGPPVGLTSSTQAPLPAGPGTPGVVYRAQAGGPDQALLGVGVPLPVVWATPVVATELPWVLRSNLFWEFDIQAWILEGVASPGANLAFTVSGAGVVSGVRSDLFSRAIPLVPDFVTEWPIRHVQLVDGTAWTEDFEDITLELHGDTDLTLRNAESSLVATQYVP